MNTGAGELGCLLLGEVGAKCSDSDVASAAGQGDGDGIDRVFQNYRVARRRAGLEELRIARAFLEQRCFALAGSELGLSPVEGLAEGGGCQRCPAA
jgi:hypothetical protein